MDYRRFGDTIIARIDKGEEVLSQLRIISEKEHITLASVNALGATGGFTVGYFDVDEKKYYATEFNGDYEIISLLGTVSTMNGEFYPHLHMSASDKDCKMYGGHLNSATISATCEMTISIIDGTADRKFSEEIGLNLLEF